MDIKKQYNERFFAFFCSTSEENGVKLWNRVSGFNLFFGGCSLINKEVK
jgi:hypothetical protein